VEEISGKEGRDYVAHWEDLVTHGQSSLSPHMSGLLKTCACRGGRVRGRCVVRDDWLSSGLSLGRWEI
jgi:hypothetical protein